MASHARIQTSAREGVFRARFLSPARTPTGVTPAATRVGSASRAAPSSTSASTTTTTTATLTPFAPTLRNHSEIMKKKHMGVGYEIQSEVQISDCKCHWELFKSK